MIVALFTDTYLPTKNGVATSVSQLKNHLQEMGHIVYVYTVQVPGYDEDEQGIIRSFSVDTHMGFDGSRLAFANVPKIAYQLKKDKVQLIHTHTEIAIGLVGRSLALFLKIPQVHTLHTMWDDYSHYAFGGIIFNHRQIAKILRTFMKRCTAVVAPSPKASSYLKRIGIESITINNGVDIAHFTNKINNQDKLALLKHLGLSQNDKIVLFVGRMASEKRAKELYSTLKKALLQVPNLKAIFIGSGIDLDEIKQNAQTDTLAHRICFTGAVPYEEIAAYYAISHIYCTVSTSEVQPMTVIEALISGLSIVARKDLAYKGLAIPGENGFLAETDDDASKAVIELATNDELQKRYANKSLEIATHFTAQRQANEMAQLYQKVIAYGCATNHSHPIHD